MHDEELGSQIEARLLNWPGKRVITEIMSRFADFEIFLVGGSIRDILLERSVPPKDFDFIVSGPQASDAVQALAQVGHLSVGPFGSSRWLPFGTNIYADIAHAQNWGILSPCSQISDCLNFFDFSANAIAYDMRSGNIIDPQNGREDITKRKIRALRFDFSDQAVSPLCALSQPVISWFRLLHYAHVLNLTIEPETSNWLVNHSHYLVHEGQFTTYFFPPNLARLNQLMPGTTLGNSRPIPIADED
jgi:hypothetical protein